MKKIIWFAVSFGLTFLLFGWCWSKAMPQYSTAISFLVGHLLANLGYPINYVVSIPQGFWHSATQLRIVAVGRDSVINLGELSFMIPVWLALVTSSLWFPWRFRVVLTVFGCLAIIVLQLGFLVVAYVYIETIVNNLEVATSVSELLVFGPILVWFVLSYNYYVAQREKPNQVIGK